MPVNIANIARRGRAPTVAELTALLSDPVKAKELTEAYDEQAKAVKAALNDLRTETTKAAKVLGDRETALAADQETHNAAVEAFTQHVEQTEQRLDERKEALDKRDRTITETEERKAAEYEKTEDDLSTRADNITAHENTLDDRQEEIEAKEDALKQREAGVKAREDAMTERESQARAFLKAS